MREMKLKLSGQCLNRTGNFLVFSLDSMLLQSIIYFSVASVSEFRLVVCVEALRMSLRCFSCIQISYHCAVSYMFSHSWIRCFAYFRKRIFTCCQVLQPRESETIHTVHHRQHRSFCLKSRRSTKIIELEPLSFTDSGEEIPSLSLAACGST